MEPDADGAREALTQGAAEDWPRYECAFCRYRSAEKSVGCPRCGAPYGYTERATAQGLRLANGVLFTLIGFSILALGVWITLEVLAGRASVDTWLFWPVVYGLGLLFFAGGVSAFCGRPWLLRFFLTMLAGGRSTRSKPR